MIPCFNHPRQPVVAVSWFRCRSVLRMAESFYRKTFIACPARRSGNARRRGGAENALYPWGDCRPEEISRLRNRWKLGP